MKLGDPASEKAAVRLALQSRGPQTSRQLQQALKVSQPTLSRYLGMLVDELERIGAARHTTYALHRPIRHLGSRWPLYRIDEQGKPETWGELRSIYGGFRLKLAHGIPDWMEETYPNGITAGLPFFLQDIRPQGFLGRCVARQAPQLLNLPRDLNRWTDDDVITYLLAEGHDLPGNLIAGDIALEQALRSQATAADVAIPVEQRETDYPIRAMTALAGELPGSSAGGEQPKFLANVRHGQGPPTAVLVKFTAADESPVRQRWADLLRCEHIAAQILTRFHIPAARSEIVAAGGRVFLQVERFDRVAASGRRGVLTLGSLQDALLDETSLDDAWTGSADSLQKAKLLAPSAARELRWRWCFGDLIANSDMHGANIGVWFGGAPPFALAPSYDMLPMLLAPGAQGDLSERRFSPRPPLPAAAEVWPEAAQAGREFWKTVSEEREISKEFREIAGKYEKQVEQLAKRFA